MTQDDETPMKRCGTAEYHQLHKEKYKHLNEVYSRSRNARLQANTFTGIITIPVVVHVIHNNANGEISGSNISDEQIKSQIEVLNEDFRKKPNTNGFNNSPVGADVEIEFCLAKIAPDGTPSTGITRHYSSQKSFDPFGDDAEIKSHDPWPANRYMNIWVASLSGGYLGVTQFPNGTNLEGMSEYNGSFDTDGMIVTHKAFGRRTGTASSGIYIYGRTVTHEIGHWLGLIHTWGDSNCGDDYCADTPPAKDGNLEKTCKDVFAKCVNEQLNKVMIENYLDYSPDICMNIFTQDQKTRMRTAMHNSPDRAAILSYISNNTNYHCQNIESSIPQNIAFEDGLSSTCTDCIADVSSNCTGSKSIFASKSSSFKKLYNSGYLSTDKYSGITLTFDYSYPKEAITDSLYVYAQSSETNQRYLLASFAGENIITTESASASFSPQCSEWKTKAINVVPNVGDKFIKIQIETSKAMKNNLYVDNIKLFALVSSNSAQIVPNPLFLRVRSGFDVNTQKIEAEVSFNGPADVKFELYDLYGRKLFEENRLNSYPGKFELYKADLTAGVYLLRTLVNGEELVKKVAIQ